jgi:hypothetical protein
MGPLGGDDPSAQLFYSVRLYSFGSEDEAAAYVETAVQDAVENGVGYNDVEEARVRGFDGATGAISFEAPLGEDQTTSGHRIWVQTGSVVVSVQADRSDGVAIGGVKSLVRRQIDCVERDRACKAVDIPETLFDQA